MHHEDDPWNHEFGPENSFGDESSLEEEQDPERIDSTNQSESYEHPTDDEVDFESYHICFSGHNQGPEAYIRWERDLEYWFLANQIPEEEKTFIAEETLTKDTFRHWERDAYTCNEYDEPDSSWEEMKHLLHKEFWRILQPISNTIQIFMQIPSQEDGF